MASEPPLALRSGQSDWETQMWAHALIEFVTSGQLSAPLIVTDEDKEQLLQAIFEFVIDNHRGDGA